MKICCQKRWKTRCRGKKASEGGKKEALGLHFQYFNAAFLDFSCRRDAAKHISRLMFLTRHVDTTPRGLDRVRAMLSFETLSAAQLHMPD